MTDPRIEALESILSPWPGTRPPAGTDEPTLRAEVEWLRASAAWQNSNGIDTGSLASELAKAEAALRKYGSSQ